MHYSLKFFLCFWEVCIKETDRQTGLKKEKRMKADQQPLLKGEID